MKKIDNQIVPASAQIDLWVPKVTCHKLLNGRAACRPKHPSHEHNSGAGQTVQRKSNISVKKNGGRAPCKGAA